MENAEFDRRVYRREFEALPGYSSEGFRQLVLRGIVKPGRRDPGGRRDRWFASEVRKTLADMAKAASAEPRTLAPKPPQRNQADKAAA